MNTNHADPLKSLEVIDRLEVGPVSLQPRRLIAPYTVHQNGVSDSFEFSYRYESDVFESDETESLNLATMMAAQIAINYGLFCRQIVVHGPLDEHDRAFLVETTENTACEIYVNKFLKPNPYLVGPAVELPTVVADKYRRAEFVFPDAVEHSAFGRTALSWQGVPGCAAVLSSGGKESLLSYSLLREMGIETHSIFINESGRHWFTALNAYRHFAAHCPPTARVWTNSDRLFAWMLRHLPFVRSDFSNVRSNEYPIRLWTVAVFLFGSLPLLRKYAVGRLVIGDEFDTTDLQTEQGIAHYNGLYDQSRYFDCYLTTYFQAKGWDIEQFSILRPLSELVIEKVLVERYPDIQRLQTSCHAAHVDGDRVRPCGRCEKCVRVVGMLTALGADPRHCGYTSPQIQRCLEQFVRHGAKLEDDALQQLAFLLQQRGQLSGAMIGNHRAQEQKQIMSLRLDPQRSPIDDVPIDLREPLYSILLEHTAGVVRREGRRWVNHDLQSALQSEQN